MLNRRSPDGTSKTAKLPALLKKSLLTVYSSSHIVHGLMPHIEQVSRDNLELTIITSLIFTLPTRAVNCPLMWSTFLFKKTKSSKSHKNITNEIMQIVERHPKGNSIRFSMLFIAPDLDKIREMTGSHTPRPNFF